MLNYLLRATQGHTGFNQTVLIIRRE